MDGHDDVPAPKPRSAQAGDTFSFRLSVAEHYAAWCARLVLGYSRSDVIQGQVMRLTVWPRSGTQRASLTLNNLMELTKDG